MTVPEVLVWLVAVRGCVALARDLRRGLRAYDAWADRRARGERVDGWEKRQEQGR